MFILSVLVEYVSVGGMAVGGWLVGRAVATLVDCALGGAADSKVGVRDTIVGDPTIGDGVGVDAGAQAAIKIAAKMSTII